jgi:hypothetical protein
MKLKLQYFFQYNSMSKTSEQNRIQTSIMSIFMWNILLIFIKNSKIHNKWMETIIPFTYYFMFEHLHVQSHKKCI